MSEAALHSPALPASRARGVRSARLRVLVTLATYTARQNFGRYPVVFDRSLKWQ